MSQFLFPERRLYQPREMAMVTEWLAKTYPDVPSLTRVRLGSPRPQDAFPGLEGEALKLLTPWSRWADAVVLAPDKTILIEAKIRPRLGPLEALDVYRLLWPSTPGFEARAKLPIETIFLYGIEDPVMVLLARQRGHKAIPYEWSGLQQYMAILRRRETRASTQGFAELEGGE